MLNIDTLLSELSPNRPKLPAPESLVELRGKMVLVTGAAGSIGSEVVRCLGLAGAEVVAVGRSELGLVQLPYLRKAIVDVTDITRLAMVIREYRPSLVIHCAAHKHVPILESNAGEAIKNNFFGTVNVVDSCIANGVDSLVVVSTDKALKPSSVMGASKRASEMYSLWRSQHGMRINCVRFANILGSSGSVLGIFEKQASENKPITITDPEMDRFFMAPQEGAMVAILAGVRTGTGRIYTTFLGEPVKIIDLANAVKKHLNSQSQIEVVGRRAGEKIHEEIYTDTMGVANGLAVYPDELFVAEDIRLMMAGLGRVINDTSYEVKKALCRYVKDYTPQ